MTPADRASFGSNHFRHRSEVDIMHGPVRWQVLMAITLAVVFSTSTSTPAQSSAFGTIERKDPRFDKLIPKDAKLEKLADGFEWSEGPVWVRDGGFLLF